MSSQSRSITGPKHPRGIAAMAASLFRVMRCRWRQRLALGRLDDRLLEDIGVTRAGAGREIGKPPWQP